jgi:protein gp37
MWTYNRHTFIVLTKRIERAQQLLSADFFETGNHIYGANIWLGVSAENQQAADERIPILLQTPAAVRFVSVEPMLGPVSLHGWDGELMRDYIGGDGNVKRGPLNWVICGCESGPGARPFSEDWACRLKDQCVEAAVPFFFKQGRHMNGKTIKMPELDGQAWAQYPEAAE